MVTSETMVATPPGAMTAQQLERRRRILDATQQLASRGGFDGVQMRTVAEHANVALGTLYRYFSSKVHLLVALTYDRTEQLAERIAKQPPKEGDPIERTTALLLLATRALQRDPPLTEAMLRAIMIADASLAAEVHRVNDLVTRMIVTTVHGPDVEPTPEDESRARVLEMVWLSSLLNWLSGRASSSDVDRDLATAARLILR
jgi:TetR/AcrR family transcriptional regulator, cholesterol catabolism regulator